MAKPRILVLSKHAHLALAVVRSLGLAGYEVLTMSSGRWPVVRFSRHNKGFSTLPHPWLEPEHPTVAPELERFCRKHQVSAIVPADLDAGLLLAGIGSELKTSALFPLPTRDQIMTCHDKWRFSRLLQRHQIPHPQTRLLESPQQLLEVDLSTPCFVKPVRGANSEGAAKLESKDDLHLYLQQNRRASCFPLLLQDFVPGQEVDMSILALEGKIEAWTIQEVGDHGATRVFSTEERVFQLGQQLVQSMDFHGVVHLDMIRDPRDGSIKILEANPRFWVTLLHSVWLGVNFAERGVQAALDQPAQSAFQPRAGICHKPSIDLRLLLRTLGRGRLRPEGLSEASRRAWKDVHLDPLPQVVHRLRSSLAL